MKTNRFKSLAAVIAASALMSAVASAQTLWTGNTSGVPNNGGNWDNGVPNNTGNVGTYSGDGANAMVATLGGQLSNKDINFTGGSPSGSGFLVVSGSELNFLTGGSYTHNTGGELSANTGSTFTVDGATMTFNDNTNFGVRQNSNNAIVNVLDGIISAFNVGNQATDPTSIFNMSNGTVNTTNQIGGAGIHNLSGGVADGGGTASFFFGNAVSEMNISGNFTAQNYVGFGGSNTNRHFDIASGWTGSISIAVAAWAEEEWVNDRLFFNGQDGTTLGRTWADVINPSVGLDGSGTEYFTYDDVTGTLALATIPEPGSFALMTGFLALGGLMVRRRRS